MKKLFTLLFGILTISSFGQISGNSEALTEIAYTYTYTGPMPNNGHIVWSTSTPSSITQNPPNGNPANITFHQAGASVVTAQVFDQFGSANTLNYNVNVTTGSPSTSTPWNENNEGELYFDGNVGIGNTNPAYKLDVTGDSRISGNLMLKSAPYIDDDTSLGGNNDDWIRLNGFIELSTVHNSHGIVLREKGSTNYMSITQRNGWSYLADQNPYYNYFLRGNGANAEVRGTLSTGGTITAASHGNSSNWKAAYDWGNHASAGYYKSGNSPTFGIITASGGNSTNWNEAHTWGNHASAGYYKSGSTPSFGNINSSGNLKLTGTGTILESTNTGVQTIKLTNDNITGVNHIQINDPGENEGIQWLGTAAKIFVSPLNSGTSDGYLRVINDGGISFEAGSEDREDLLIKSNGYVGIGTVDPKTKLHVNGSIRGNQSGAIRISTGHGYVDIGPKNSSWSHFTTDRSRFYFDKGITVDQGLVGSYNEDLKLQTSGTTRLTLSRSTGNATFTGSVIANGLSSIGVVRLGSTTIHNDSPILYVNGGSYFTDINVQALTAWPDYVFSKKYQLKSLEETEEFIEENSHLPEVPSAQEIEEDGIDVAKMDAILLKKIEELTLHLIEQNKQIKQLTEKVKSLENN